MGSEMCIRDSVRALSSLLDEHRLGAVDLFSLDVEGYEVEVLRGLDFSRHAPRFILVETAKPDEVAALLGGKYELREKFSYHDYLFTLRDI